MKLDDIGFYTLSDERAKFVAKQLRSDNFNSFMSIPISRCEIIITNKCNFSCPYCRGIDCNEMKSGEFGKIIHTLGDIKNIRFSGGEPTMNPYINYMVAFARWRRINRVAVSTNGSADFQKYVDLVNLGANDFSISLDACCASDGDMMTGGVNGAWDKVVDNIKRLSAITYVTVGIVITEDNVEHVNDIVQFADTLGVSDIRVIPSAQYNVFLRALKSIDPKLYENRPILKYRVNNAIQGNHVRGLREKDTARCPLVLDDIAIKGDEHYPCIIYMREKGKPIGKLSDDAYKIRYDRLVWFNTHNTHEDPICKANCLDVCIDYNNICSRYISH